MIYIFNYEFLKSYKEKISRVQISEFNFKKKDLQKIYKETVF